jgi:transcription antitermination factor NusG
MMRWHVVQTKPFSEMLAEEGIRRKGFQPFNPKVYVHRIVRGARTWTERCYIPGYIFVQFDAEAQPQWPTINFVRGVKALLYSAHETPAPVRDSAMRVLFERCNGDRVKAEDIDTALSRVLPLDAQVRILSGPFEHHVGRVAWTDAERVRVVLSLFGRATKVELKTRAVALT